MTQGSGNDDIKLALHAQKDAKTADYLLSRLEPRVWQLVRMFRGTRQETEELCQICLTKILENLHKYRGEGSLESWAGQVAYRVSMRQVKRTRRREAREIPIDDEVGLSNASSGSNPEVEVARAAVWRRLLYEMRRSHPERYISLLLHLSNGYTVDEVAEVTGVSKNTTKDRLRTAYAELRAIFERNASLKREILELIHE